MRELQWLCIGEDPSLYNWSSWMPGILASLPPSLRSKLPNDFLESSGIMVLPPAANTSDIARQKADRKHVESLSPSFTCRSHVCPSDVAAGGLASPQKIGASCSPPKLTSEATRSLPSAVKTATANVTCIDTSMSELVDRFTSYPTPDVSLLARTECIVRAAWSSCASYGPASAEEWLSPKHASRNRGVLDPAISTMTSRAERCTGSAAATRMVAVSDDAAAPAAPASLPLSPKSPAPALANADAVELEGLNIEKEDSRGRGTTVKHGGLREDGEKRCGSDDKTYKHTSGLSSPTTRLAPTPVVIKDWLPKEPASAQDQSRATSDSSHILSRPAILTMFLSTNRRSSMMCSVPGTPSARLTVNALATTRVPPLSKSPAPALANADAVELGGLRIGVAEPRAKASAVERGGYAQGTAEKGGLHVERAEACANTSVVELGDLQELGRRRRHGRRDVWHIHV
ncbi:hypothetical protein C8R47DRAFT_1171088 [Mycena vitilis]|nr:hypothetical protein C8R47DRAFT_1171088 [Mycena vitilis]